MARLYRLLEVLQRLNGDPTSPVDEVALAKQWGVSERTAYRLAAQARLLLKELNRRGVTIHFTQASHTRKGRTVVL